MIIGFHTPRLDVRGSCDALYNYAKYSEELYQHTSIIFTPEEISKENEEEGIKRFIVRFKIVYYTNLEDSLKKYNCDILYVIKYGKNDGLYSVNIPTLIHCVFTLEDPHGSEYIAVSKALANKYGKKEYLPHMVGMKPILHNRNMRKILNIKENSLVIGRYGGMDTFNLDFVKMIISKIVRENDNIYFIFMNTPIFDNHSHIIFLNKTSDIDTKEMFINTCDAGLEASTLGHTFGLSCAEFSINQKPLIIYNGPVWNNAHIRIIGKKGLYFKTPEEFKIIIINLQSKENIIENDLNCYRKYSIMKVMKKFNNHLISISKV